MVMIVPVFFPSASIFTWNQSAECSCELLGNWITELPPKNSSRNFMVSFDSYIRGWHIMGWLRPSNPVVMKANPGVPTGFSIKCSILCRQQYPQSFQINVDSCLFIPIDEISTDRTNIGPVRKLQFFVDISALTAGLTGWKPFIYLDDVTAVPVFFIQEHGNEHSPSIITIGFPKIECLFQSRHIQILDTDQVIFPGQLFGKLMQAILTLMLDFRMQPCDYLKRFS